MCKPYEAQETLVFDAIKNSCVRKWKAIELASLLLLASNINPTQ